MTAFFTWYLLITILGWLTVPLAWRLFSALPDRGYTLARAAGLLVWGYVFWLLASFGFIHNDTAGQALALLVILGLSLWAAGAQRGELLEWLRGHWRVLLASEVLFLAAFALMAFIRSANPEIIGTEKPMELAFINATLDSPSFPPRDPWLSGYAISYYHFGYILTAMLARFTGIPGTMAFNLMLALIFGMAALGSYGILHNLLALLPSRGDGEASPRHSPLGLPLLGPLFLLIVSNVEGFLEVLHRLGIFWKFDAVGSGTSAFWSWLDMKDLTVPPTLPLGLVADRFRYLWWWRASRVVQDYDLAHNFQEVIDEFPAFSFLLGDLHPHVLAIPFGLLAVAFALNLYLGGLRGSVSLLGARLYISPLGFFCAAFLLGGMAFLNIWDILIAAGLIGLGYVLRRVREAGWSWSRLEDLLLLLLPMGLAALLLYLPFFLGFSSQAGGILPNLATPTRGAHLWVMFGTLLLPLGAYLVYLLFHSSTRRVGLALGVALGLPLVLWVASWIIAWVVMLVRPEFAGQFLTAQGATGFGSYFAATTLKRLGSIASLLTLSAVLFPALALLFSTDSREETEEVAEPQGGLSEPVPFVVLLITLGALLVLVPEFVYLRDQFGTRMNTIFKFYYQAWMLWSLAAAFGSAYLLTRLRGAAGWFFSLLLVVVLGVGLTYPMLAFATRTNNFKPAAGFTLDDFDRIQRDNPDEAGAIEYLRQAPDGVVAEAVGGSYSGFARISTYSGLPTVLGWPWHEVQWRGTAEPLGSREDDIRTLYATRDWGEAQAILAKYNIRYVVVGGLERQAYPVQEDKFRENLQTVYQTGTISIYAVP